MIPKQIFFIWINKNIKKPNYVDFTINMYKKINPQFSVDLLLDDYYNPKNEIVKKILFKCFNAQKSCGDSELDSIFEYEVNSFTKKHYIKKKYILVLCDVLRVYLTYKYGGIYLDCDTFPVKPFDDKLLSEPFQCYTDNFCHGGLKGDIITNNNKLFQNKQYFRYIRTYYKNTCNFIYKEKPVEYNCLNLRIQKYKFYNCKIEYGSKVLNDYDGDDYYLDHFINNEHRK